MSKGANARHEADDSGGGRHAIAVASQLYVTDGHPVVVYQTLQVYDIVVSVIVQELKRTNEPHRRKSH